VEVLLCDTFTQPVVGSYSPPHSMERWRLARVSLLIGILKLALS